MAERGDLSFIPERGREREGEGEWKQALPATRLEVAVDDLEEERVVRPAAHVVHADVDRERVVLAERGARRV